MKLKKILRLLIPKKARIILFELIPKFDLLNTYLLENPAEIINLHTISNNFIIRKVGWKDSEKIKEIYNTRSENAFKRLVHGRLDSPAWVGLAVLDKSNGVFAYLSWIINNRIPYTEEFGIDLKEKHYLVKDGYCHPEYRHQRLHTRMEQERINYCIRHGAEKIFIQIHDSNKKGISSVTGNGYRFYKQDYVIMWPIFNIYRELYSFLKRPFRKVVK